MNETSTCPALIAAAPTLPFSVVVMTQENFKVIPGSWTDYFDDAPVLGVSDGSVSFVNGEFHALEGERVSLQKGMNVLVRCSLGDDVPDTAHRAGLELRLGSNGTVVPYHVSASSGIYTGFQFISLQPFRRGEVFWARRVTGHAMRSG